MTATFLQFARAAQARRRAVAKAAHEAGVACNLDCLLATEDECKCDCQGANHGLLAGMRPEDVAAKVALRSRSGGVAAKVAA